MNDDRTQTGEPTGLVDATGRPLRKAKNTSCPRCGAGRDRRVLSAGFGQPHDVCRDCGYEFEERTL